MSSFADIPPGRHVVEAAHDSYNPYRFELTVTADDYHTFASNRYYCSTAKLLQGESPLN